MKVGLIDPALRRAGHHVEFLSYLHALLRRAGLEVTVADFDHVVRRQSEIPPEAIVNVADWLPTELFPGQSQQPVAARLAGAYRKWRAYSQLNLDRLRVDSWLIATYDPYSLPLLRYAGIRAARTLPIIHYSKFFRRAGFNPLRVTRYWTPLLLLRRLKQAKGALCLLEEHREHLNALGFHGRCQYLSYNSVPEDVIRTDNRSALSRRFRLCTLGILRPDKDIHLVLRALRNCRGVEYFIGGEPAAGIAQSSWFADLQSLLREVPGATANLAFLPAGEYRRQIEKSHFAVVPIGDKYQRGVQQTGLLVDSLVNKRPVIGPDVFPVNTWVRDYGVGLLYRPGDMDSLRSAIEEARRRGVDAFYGNICRFLERHSFERNAVRIRDALFSVPAVR